MEEAIIGKHLSNTNINDGSRSHYWNDEDHAFDHKLYQWSVEKLFQTLDEVIIRELKIYVDEREEFNLKTRAKYLVLCFWKSVAI